MAPTIRKHPIKKLHPHPDDIRHSRSEQHIESLGDACEANNDVPRPLLVNPRPDGDFDIICGVTSWMAALRRGLTEVSICIPEKPLTDEQIEQEMLMENLRRKQLTIIEEGAHYLKMMKRRGWKQTQLGARLKIPISRVNRALKSFERCTTEVKDFIASGQLHGSFAPYLADVEPAAEQNAIASRVVAERMKRSALIDIVKQRLELKEKPKKRLKSVRGRKGEFQFAFKNPDLDAMKTAAEELLKAIEKAQKLGLSPHVVIDLLGT